MKARKGITPVIAIVLLLMITIAITGFAYISMTNIFAQAQNSTAEQAGSRAAQIQSAIVIESITNNAIYIRNTGTVALEGSKISVYVNNGLIEGPLSPDPLPPSSTGTITLPNTLADRDQIRLTTPGNEVTEIFNE